jgi:hypothetical protein
MHKLCNDLWAAFDSYFALQEAHLHSLESMAMPDIAKLSFERARAFTELKNRLIAMVQKLQTDDEARQLSRICQQRLTILRERDTLLAKRAREYRTTLEHRLAQLRRGQRVLNAYGGLDVPCPPKFLSSAV